MSRLIGSVEQTVRFLLALITATFSLMIRDYSALSSSVALWLSLALLISALWLSLRRPAYHGPERRRRSRTWSLASLCPTCPGLSR